MILKLTGHTSSINSKLHSQLHEIMELLNIIMLKFGTTLTGDLHTKRDD